MKQLILALFFLPCVDLADEPAPDVAALKERAEAGMHADYDLGCRYWNGQGVTKDPTEAVKWFRKGAELGDGPSMSVLASCYLNGQGVSTDYAEAAKWYGMLAAKGDPVAERALGWIYSSGGNGVTVDVAQGMKWYRKAADQGDSYSINALGRIYLFGQGVEKNGAEAMRWFSLGASKGDGDSEEMMGRLHDPSESWSVAPDIIEAQQWFTKAAGHGNLEAKKALDRIAKLLALEAKAEGGDAESEYVFGDALLNGNGVAVDNAAARKWFGKAAGQGYEPARTALAQVETVDGYTKKAEVGDAAAQYALGMAYLDGEGVKSDYASGLNWIYKAADQGYAEAESALGRFYASGSYIQRDLVEAIKWHRKAAEQGHPFSEWYLGAAYLSGKDGIAKDRVQGLKWLQASAEQGSPLAAFALGNVYFQGDGVTKDVGEGLRWYRAAAEKGDEEALSTLVSLYAESNEVPKDPVEAQKWFRKAADEGDAAGQKALGDLYATGEGVPKDLAEAQRWYQKAAEQGNDGAKKALSAMGNSHSPTVSPDAVPNPTANAIEDAPASQAASNPWPEPFAALKAKADGGDAESLYAIGEIYGLGIAGVTRDPVESTRALTAAAKKGHIGAECRLGWMCLNGLSVPADEAEAAAWFAIAAVQGSAVGQCALGTLHYCGRGVPRDEAKAAKWWRLAAQQGYADAQWKLGWLLANGRDVPRDPKEAAALWKKAHAHRIALFERFGDQLSLGRSADLDIVQASTWYHRAEAEGSGAIGGLSQIDAAIARQREGQAGATPASANDSQAAAKSPPEDLEALEADAGPAEGEYTLGMLYYHSTGDATGNLVQADAWLRSAVKHGSTRALRALSEKDTPIEWNGDNFRFCRTHPYDWFELLKAKAEAGDGNAALLMYGAYTDPSSAAGQFVDADVDTGAAWLVKAAREGNPAGQEFLGKKLMDLGAGASSELAAAVHRLLLGNQPVGEADAAEALKWYIAKANNPNTAASQLADIQTEVGSLFFNGTPGVPKDPAEAMKWLRLAGANKSQAALIKVGQLYERGLGVAADPTEALAWYKKAAALQHDANAPSQQDSEYRVALRTSPPADVKSEIEAANFYVGSDPQDLEEAAKWFLLAARHGDSRAQATLGDMYHVGAGVPKDEAQADAWWSKAEAQGVKTNRHASG